MAKISRFARDQETARAGRWVRYREDIELCIASTSQPEWQSAYREAVRVEREAARGEPNLDDTFLSRHGKLIATHILKGWKNLEGDDGKPLPYSVEDATRLLSDPSLTDLRVFVLMEANKDEAYQRRLTEAARGN